MLYFGYHAENDCGVFLLYSLIHLAKSERAQGPFLSLRTVDSATDLSNLDVSHGTEF